MTVKSCTVSLSVVDIKARVGYPLGQLYRKRFVMVSSSAEDYET